MTNILLRQLRILAYVFMLLDATCLVYPTTARAQVLATTTLTDYMPLTTSINYTTYVTTGQSGSTNCGSFGPFDRACAATPPSADRK
jgi:hypothetical protein